MATKNVTESARIVVRTSDGASAELTHRGDAAEGMHAAFCFLSMERQASLLLRMQATHAKRFQVAA